MGRRLPGRNHSSSVRHGHGRRYAAARGAAHAPPEAAPERAAAQRRSHGLPRRVSAHGVLRRRCSRPAARAHPPCVRRLLQQPRRDSPAAAEQARHHERQPLCRRGGGSRDWRRRRRQRGRRRQRARRDEALAVAAPSKLQGGHVHEVSPQRVDGQPREPARPALHRKAHRRLRCGARPRLGHRSEARRGGPGASRRQEHPRDGGEAPRARATGDAARELMARARGARQHLRRNQPHGARRLSRREETPGPERARLRLGRRTLVRAGTRHGRRPLPTRLMAGSEEPYINANTINTHAPAFRFVCVP
mmetsp:Transcript_22511/g.73142  ORF Transcript_22511/g.73142 Transcript_22511/m.73142 type:complete len:306 (+) Transcript_22511:1036-1953(+)